MAYPKIWRDPKLDKVFDGLRPLHRARLVSGEYGKPLNEAGQPVERLQQSPQQLLECLDNCRQQIAFYTELERIYRERLEKLRQPCSSLPCHTSLKRNRTKAL